MQALTAIKQRDNATAVSTSAKEKVTKTQEQLVNGWLLPVFVPGILGLLAHCVVCLPLLPLPLLLLVGALLTACVHLLGPLRLF